MEVLNVLIRTLRFVGVAAVAAAAVLVPTSPAMAAPTYRVPFHCEQQWQGSTREDHSPRLAVDFNRAGDVGDHVLASADGVAQLHNAGDQSYGRYIIINHGNGHSTLYAHLSGFNVDDGQRVNSGRVIGFVGTSGNSTGPHLHYEQRVDGNDVRAKFGAETEVFYFGTRTYTRQVECQP